MEDPLGLVGQKIDEKYQIDSVVGEGGFAVVYKATHLLFKRPVAVKAFRTLCDFGPAAREQLIQEFMQEGRLLAELSERSAAIVQARDIGTLTTPKGEWVPYMVLEWLDGATLEAVIAQERASNAPPRSIEQTVALLDPVAEALALAHRKGVAHRDVKPGNIFILGDAHDAGAIVVKLLDFGIAKVVQDVQKLGGSFQKTSGHLTSFTPTYGAPEQYSRTYGATGPWTDVFALGVVLWELTTGQRLFRMESDLDTLAKVQECNVTRPSTLVRGYPLDLEKIVMKALSKNRGERFKTAREFSRALQSLLMKRGLFIASDEVASYTKSIFQDRIQKREAHLRWAAEVTQTISLDQLEKAGAGATQEPSMQSYKSEVQPAQKAPPPARGAPLPAPRPAAGMPAIPGIGLSQTGETRAARGSIPSAARPSTPHDEQDETDDGPTIMSAAPEVEDDFDDSDATMVKIPDAPRAAGAPPPAAGRRAAPEPPVSQPQTAIAVPPRALPSRNIDHAPLPAVVVEHSSAPPQARVPTVPPNKGLNTTLAMPSRPSAQPALPFPFPQHQQHHQHQHYDQPIAQPPLPMPFQAQAPLPPLDQRTVEIRAIKSGVPIWAVALLSGAAALILLSVVYIVAVPGKKPAPVVAPVGSSRAPFTAARVKFDEALAPTSLINDAPPAFPSALASAPPVVSALPVASARPSVAAVTHNTPTTQPVVNNPPTNTGTKPLPMALPASPYGNPSTGGGGKIATGQLTVICKPSCDTILDGTTSLPIPVYKKALPVGQHRLRLVSNGIMKTITVMILADQVDVETVSMTP